MPIRNGFMVSEAMADSFDLEDSNRRTNIESNKLGLESAKLSNESARIDNEAKKAALKNSAKTSQMTNAFLSKWGDMNQQSIEILMNSLNSSYQMPDTYKSSTYTAPGAYKPSTYAAPDISKEMESFNSILDNISNQVTSFGEEYGGMTKSFMDSAMSDITTKQGLVSDLTGMAKADYKGVSGRAAADVGTQSEITRGDMAREAMSYGIDPTSGKFGALQKKSYLGEAKNKVAAMNRARMMEKDRSAALTATAINSIDPSVSGNLATNLMNQQAQLYGLQVNAAGAVTAAEKTKYDNAFNYDNLNASMGLNYDKLNSENKYNYDNLNANTKLNYDKLNSDNKYNYNKLKSDTALGVANQMANIGSQYGSLGSTMLGLQTAAGTYSRT